VPFQDQVIDLYSCTHMQESYLSEETRVARLEVRYIVPTRLYR